MNTPARLAVLVAVLLLVLADCFASKTAYAYTCRLLSAPPAQVLYQPVNPCEGVGMAGLCGL